VELLLVEINLLKNSTIFQLQEGSIIGSKIFGHIYVNYKIIIIA
jgi:hypothetical protein